MSLKQIVRALVASPFNLFGADVVGPRTVRRLKMYEQLDKNAPNLLKLLAPAICRGGVLQIGANDGEDELGQIIADQRCQAVLVEPLPHLCELLKARYAECPEVTVVNCAVSDSQGKMKLYRFVPDRLGKTDLTVFTSTFRHQLENWKAKRRFDAEIEELEVACDSVANILRSAGASTVSCLVIDTEGFDFEILKSIDFLTFRPLFVQWEHHQMSYDDQAASCSLMAKYGYQIVRGRYDLYALLQDEIESSL